MDSIIQKLNLKEIKKTVCKNINNCTHVEACLKCVTDYIDQDHVYQRESLIGDKVLKCDKLALKTHEAYIELKNMRSRKLPKLKSSMEKAGLTTRQKQVISSYFLENLSFFEISKKLKISKACAYEHYKAGIKKLENTLTIFL